MEHLHLPVGYKSCLDPLYYLCREPKYDGEGFEGFLERINENQGSLIDEIKKASLLEQPLNRCGREKIEWATSLLQEWCWFGLLDEWSRYTGVAINLADFITESSEDGGKALLTTKHLTKYVEEVAQLHAGWAQPKMPVENSALDRCVRVIDRVTMLLDPLLLPVPIRSTLFHVRLLCEAVQSATKAIFGEILPCSVSCFLPRSDTWCPTRCNYLNALGSPSMKVVSFSLPSYDSRHHTSCTSDRCFLSLQLACSIKPTHVNDCKVKNCKDLYVEKQSLLDVLRHGGNPGVKLTADNCDIAIEDVTSKRYVAISHVWAQGLGNSLSNSLPWCQVRRLMQLVRELAGQDTLLWIDTLSVPHDPSWKQRAITKLRHVYREAEAVLVLDCYLEQVGTDPIERSLQLLGSEWMTRLWTLQEGRLASKLYVRYRKANVHIDTLIDPVTHASPEVQRNVFVDASGIRRALDNLFVSSSGVARRFGQLAINLAYRNVTIPSDEPICLATLLGIPLEGFLDHAPAMADVYRAFPDDIPQDLVFFHGARLSERGLRWAPASLMRQPTFHTWTHDRGTLMTSNSSKCESRERDVNAGLLIEKDYITFTSSLSTAAGVVSKEYAYVTSSLVNGAENMAFFLLSPSEGIELPLLCNTAVVLHTPGNAKPPSSRAVLVEKIREAGEVQYCRFICNVQTVRGDRIRWAIDTLWKSPPQRQVHATLRHTQICID